MKKYIAIISSMLIFLSVLFAVGFASSSWIQLLEPEQHALLSEQPSFSFSTSVDATNCSLYVNGTIADTVVDVLENSVYTLNDPSLTQGSYNWYVSCLFNQTAESESREFLLDTESPQITLISPQQGESQSDEDINITIEVNEAATCRMDSSNRSFDDMRKSFHYGELHWLYLVDLQDDDYRYHIKCRDDAGNVGYAELQFSIAGPLSGRVEIDTNVDEEDHYFLPRGRKSLEFKTSRLLDEAPLLYYQYEDGSKHDVALTGTGRSWHGYVIIEPKVNDKVAIFSASYDNEPIEITEGQMFVVDSQLPEMPETLQGLDKGSSGVLLEWYYDGEEVDYFRLYRATTERLTQLDLLTTVQDTLYTDHTAEPGMSYWYRVSAVDLAGNEGPMSPILKITVGLPEDAPEKVNPKVVSKLNLTHKLLQELELDLLSAKNNLNSISELKTRAIIDEFGLITQIETKLEELESYKEQIADSYQDSEALVDKKIEEIALFEKEVKATVVNGISFEGVTEKRQALTKSDSKLVTEAYLKETGNTLSDKEQTQFLEEVFALNSQVDVSTELEVYQLTMLDSSDSQLSKLTKTLQFQGTADYSDVNLVEYIPKAMAASSQDLKVTTLGFEVIKQDPIIAWQLDELGATQRTISYFVKTEFDLNELDNLISLYIPPVPETTTAQSPGATGNVVSEAVAGGFNLHKLGLSLGGLVILSLFIYYFVFMKGGPSVQRSDFSLGNLGRKDNDFGKMLRRGHELIDKLNYNAARHLYVYLTELLQTELGVDQLGDQHKRGLQELHTKLKLFRSIAKAQELLESKSHKELSHLLDQLQPLMLQLKLTQKDSQLTRYLQHWYYHYVNLVDYTGKK